MLTRRLKFSGFFLKGSHILSANCERKFKYYEIIMHPSSMRFTIQPQMIRMLSFQANTMTGSLINYRNLALTVLEVGVQGQGAAMVG